MIYTHLFINLLPAPKLESCSSGKMSQLKWELNSRRQRTWIQDSKEDNKDWRVASDVLVCSLNSAPAEILPRHPILFPRLSLDSRAGCPCHPDRSQVLNYVPNSYQGLPLPTNKFISVIIKVKARVGQCTQRILLSCTLLPSSCSGISSCAAAQEHKDLDSGQGLHHFSRIPPLPHHCQVFISWSGLKVFPALFPDLSVLPHTLPNIPCSQSEG